VIMGLCLSELTALKRLPTCCRGRDQRLRMFLAGAVEGVNPGKPTQYRGACDSVPRLIPNHPERGGTEELEVLAVVLRGGSSLFLARLRRLCRSTLTEQGCR
jgi:hypothetical protein